MKQYETYKESGVEWIGEFPEHWKIKRIKHTTYVKGRIGWKGLKSDEFLEVSDSYVVTGTDFKDGVIKWDTCYQVPKDRYDEDPFIQLKNDDLLITKDGTIGKIAVVKNIPKIATLNSGVFVTRPISDDYYAEYMYWVLVSEVFISFYDFNKSGSTIQHLYQNVFNEFKFTCPSLKEQTQIANYLNNKTAQLDTLIAKKEQLISLLQEERTAMINQVVTKGLDPNVPMKDSGIEWLGEIPEHWSCRPLKALSTITRLAGAEYTSFWETSEDGEMKVLRGQNIGFNEIIEKSIDRISNDLSMKLIRSRLIKGDVVFPCVGSVGNAVVIKNSDEWHINQNIARITPKSIDSELLCFYLLSHSSKFQINLHNSSDMQPSVLVRNLRKFTIPLPPISEQKYLVKSLNNRLKKMEITISKSLDTIRHLKEYKTALISEVVTGKVDVREEVLAQ